MNCLSGVTPRIDKITSLFGIRKNKKDFDVSSSFVYVPSIGLYVSKDKLLFGKEWHFLQSTLHSSSQKMLSLSEFWEFLKFVRLNDKQVYQGVIHSENQSYEWIDAQFENNSGNFYMTYHFFNSSGKIVKRKEMLGRDTFVRDKKCLKKISLERLFNGGCLTSQGLPSNKSTRGSFYYGPPVDGRVAIFGTNPEKKGLYCYNPPSLCGSIGVRIAVTDLKNASDF